MDKLQLAATRMYFPGFDSRKPEAKSLEAYQTPTEAHHNVLRKIKLGMAGFMRWFALLGTTGAGKTMLSIGMALEILIRLADKNELWYEHEGSWHWKPQPIALAAKGITYHQLIQTIRFNPKEWREVRRDFWTTVLIIDEVRQIKLNDFEEAAVDELLNLRYENRLHTIFVSNLYEEQFWQVLGDRIKSRFSELGRGNMIGFTSVPDWRGRDLELDPVVEKVKPDVRRDSRAQ